MPLTITVNNSEQHRIEHQIMVNNLLGTLQPTEMVENGFGSALGKGIRKVGIKASPSVRKASMDRVKTYGSMAKQGVGKAVSKISGSFSKHWGEGLRGSSAQATGRRQALAGGAIGGAVGGATVGAMSRKKKK